MSTRFKGIGPVFLCPNCSSSLSLSQQIADTGIPSPAMESIPRPKAPSPLEARNLPSDVSNKDSVATSSPQEIESVILPPRFHDPDYLDRMLPPKFNVHDHFNVAEHKTTKASVMLPDGHGGYIPVNDRVVYVTANGEKIPLVLTDRMTRWRNRVLFNVIAMIICLAILFTVFVLIMPTK